MWNQLNTTNNNTTDAAIASSQLRTKQQPRPATTEMKRVPKSQNMSTTHASVVQWQGSHRAAVRESLQHV